jgi:hypothetical protein
MLLPIAAELIVPDDCVIVRVGPAPFVMPG